MKPLHYLIHLEPDLKELVFKGFTTIKMELIQPNENIVLNVKNLTITECKLGVEPDLHKCQFNVLNDEEQLEITFPSPQNGKIQVRIEFEGELNDMLLGFYRSKYEIDGEERFLATTQFEEREARAAFPCFDHPSLKAKFDIEFVIEKNLQAISNTAIREENILPNNKKLVQFQTTPPMSTYLLYFGIGEFEFLEDASKDPLIRVATTPGKIQYGNFALDMGRKSIDFGEEFTGVDYPLSKCDHIAIADFAYGAMENFGAITYRENYLLVHPGKTPKPLLVRIGSVIAHETAHMWFGDIVSPADWKYIWLNESFASYFTYAIPDKYYPEWNVWEEFIQQSYRGIKRDSLKFTVPIELPGEDAEINIDTSSAPIIYSKGAAIIRVLEGYLGKEKFQQGIKAFLEKFKFDVATSADYWEAFEEATGEPIQDFADAWVHQKGFPVINVTLENGTLHLSQNRFTYLPNDEETSWLIPIKILLIRKDGTQKVMDIVMKEKNMTLNLEDEIKTLKLNHLQKGFYRVKYPAETWNKLGELCKQKKLNAYDRFGIISDYAAMVQAQEISLNQYLDFIEEYFLEEYDYLPLSEIAEFLNTIFLLNEKYRKKVKQIGVNLFDNILEKMGLEPKEEDTIQIASLRNTILWLDYLFESELAVSFGEAKFEDLLAGGRVHADIYSSIVKIGAASNEKAIDFFMKQFKDPKVPESEKQAILSAMGKFLDQEKLKQALEWNLTKVPKRNRQNILMSVAKNIKSHEWMWDYYKDHLQTFVKELPKNIFANSIVGIIPIVAHNNISEGNTILSQIESMEAKAKDIVAMAKEMLEIYHRIASM